MKNFFYKNITKNKSFQKFTLCNSANLLLEKQQNSIFDIKKILQFSRVTKVRRGSRRYTIRIVSVIGNKRGKIGLGVGRGQYYDIALNNSFRESTESFIHIPITKSGTLPLYTEATYVSSKIKLFPSSSTTGLIIGGSARTLLDLAGIKNILGIQTNSLNILNSAKATFKSFINLNNRMKLLSSNKLTNFV